MSKYKRRRYRRHYNRRYSIWTVIAAIIIAIALYVIENYGGTGYIPSWDQIHQWIGLEPSQGQTTIQPAEGETDVVFLDVGQGDAVLILQNGSACLIDAGPSDARQDLVQELRSFGVDKLDLLVMTHPHADHTGGMQAVMQNFDVETLLTPDLDGIELTGLTQRTLQTAQDCGVPVETAQTGQQYTIGTGTLTVLLAGVDAETAAGDDQTNDMSLCLRFEAGNFTFLDTGDAERNEEAALVQMYPFRLRSTVFKAGHHGSSTSNTMTLLRQVQPQYVVASCGLNNDYGHPHREVIQEMQDEGIDFYRTDLYGTVIIAAQEDGTVTVQTTRQPDEELAPAA